jgi:predicted DNA-binding transcriptional regulator YafY
MSRTERLLELLQTLRRRRYAVSGRALADEMGVSLRTVYRDIATLQAQGAPITGEAGVGYVLRPGYILPPLMFTTEEIEALVLGARWVIDRADDQLAMAARNALSKIRSVVPLHIKHDLETGTLLIPSQARPIVNGEFIECIRRAIREETKVALAYRDSKDQRTQRVIWPFGLAFYDQAVVVMAWCELRQDFRHFRADRVEAWDDIRIDYPRKRLDLLREWQKKEGIPLEKYDL